MARDKDGKCTCWFAEDHPRLVDKLAKAVAHVKTIQFELEVADGLLAQRKEELARNIADKRVVELEKENAELKKENAKHYNAWQDLKTKVSADALAIARLEARIISLGDANTRIESENAKLVTRYGRLRERVKKAWRRKFTCLEDQHKYYAYLSLLDVMEVMADRMLRQDFKGIGKLASAYARLLGLIEKMEHLGWRRPKED